ncbi:MAG: flavodoxin domain-containing protein [Lachnospiraceae bacterium]
MKTVVVYHSQTGFTKRYAEWIAEAAGADCFDLAEAKKKNLDAYEAVVFGSWACAGGISKLGWLKSNAAKWADKKLIAFCVGASPMESPEVEKALKQNFGASELQSVNAFYCPGGLNYEKMSAPSRIMMKLFVKTLQAKKDKTQEEQEMVKMISASYDIADRKYIGPILECLKK